MSRKETPKGDSKGDSYCRGVPPTLERVFRGGSFENYAELLQVLLRGGLPPRTQYGFIGFRLILERVPEAAAP